MAEKEGSVPKPYTSSWDITKGEFKPLSEKEKAAKTEKVRLIRHYTKVKEYWYDEESFGVSLEPKYFWILDFIKKIGFVPIKHMEQIGASVVSQFFGEMSMRKQHLEKRGMEILATVNTVVRSVINLLYDLREFDRRISIYNDLKSDEKKKKDASDKALKRVWMDEVDIRKGNGSINAMAAQRGLEFTTLRDAFMIANNLDDLEKMDINRRVKDVLKGRLEEYVYWRDESEKELRQRKRIEVAYLQSQIHSLKLYSQWARPYLEAAQRLSFEDVNVKDPELIQAFDQNQIRIMIRATKKYHQKDFFKRAALERGYSAPVTWSKAERAKAETEKRGPSVIGVLEIEFIYRTKPTMVAQSQTGGAYRQAGKVDIYFRGFAMSEAEYKLLEQQEDFEAMKFIEGMTTESLEAMKGDIERYLAEGSAEEEKAKAAAKPQALLDKFLGVGKSAPSAAGGPAILGEFANIGEQSIVNRTKAMLRSEMYDKTFTVYDIFKKAHKLLSFPYFPLYTAPPPPK